MTMRGAGALIHCPSTDRYLIAKRSEGGDAAGYWCCLGGGVDAGETVMQALFRELYEEANIEKEQILTVEPMAQVVYNNGYIFYNFIATCDSELCVTLNDEHDGYLWVTKRQLNSMLLHPSFKLALEYYYENRSSKTPNGE